VPFTRPWRPLDQTRRPTSTRAADLRPVWRSGLGCVVLTALASNAFAQNALTWSDVRARLQASNPMLQAGRLTIEESKADEITAYLRPNPDWVVTFDQVGTTEQGTPFSGSTLSTAVSYLHERRRKRELRRDSAAGDTTIARSTQADLERELLFMLRSAFVRTLQAKALQALAEENLRTYDQVLSVGRDRLQTGDIAQVDLDRLELQRVTYVSDVQTATVNLRTAKIQLLRLLDEHGTPLDQFDVSGPYDFAPPPSSLDDLRGAALEHRPDLHAAVQAIEKARTDHRLAIANGSSDPTITVNAGFPTISQAYLGYTPPMREYLGISVGLPLRIFDRNQGEKQRTQIEITRNERLADAARLQALSDVDTAYATLVNTVTLLQPYRTTYLDRAARVRDTVTFSYQRGGVSLLDFFQAEQEYRTLRVSYVNLVAAYLNAAAQLNLAVGRDVIP